MAIPRVVNWEEESDDVFGPPATEFFIKWGHDLATGSGLFSGDGASASGVFNYVFNTAITAPPAPGEIRFNNTVHASMTSVWAANISADSVDNRHLLWRALQGTRLVVVPKSDLTKYVEFLVTFDPSPPSASHVTFTVTYFDSSGFYLPPTGTPVYLFFRPAAVPLSFSQATGDLVVGAGQSGWQRLAAPTNSGDVLTVDTALGQRMKWAAPPGASGTLPADTVVVAGTRIVSNKLLVGDAQPAFRFLGDGKHEWGPGGAGALNTNLYRAGTNWLASGGDFSARGGLANQVTIGDQSGMPAIQLGGVAGSVNIYRSAASQVTVDGVLVVNANSAAVNGSLYLDNIGSDPAQKLYFGVARDTNLYRAAANVLKTDDSLYSAIDHVANAGAAGQIWLHTDGSIYLGITADVRLYRSAALELRTNSNFYASQLIAYGTGNVFVDYGLVGGKLIFGSASDTSLYRYTAGSLRTDGGFIAQGSLAAGWTGSAWAFTATSAGITFADGTIQSTAATAGGTLVTALPGSPINGQEVTFTDSLTAPTYYWRLKYNSTTTKWHFVGGTALTRFDAPYTESGTTTGAGFSGTWADIETNSAVTVPLAGDYEVRCETGVGATQSGTQSNEFFFAVAPKFGAATTQLMDTMASAGYTAGAAPTTGAGLATRTFRPTGLAAGALIKYQYQNANRVASTYNRRISVVPVKVG